MIEVTQLNGRLFSLNDNFIEDIENIPETKVSLTNGKYYLVQESREEITNRVVEYKRRIYSNILKLIVPAEE